MIELRPDLARSFTAERDVAAFLAIDDAMTQHAKGRSIGRFERSGRGYYIKKHRACGWGAIFDDLIHGRPPHIGARPEYQAIRQCEQLGIDTLTIAAFGEQGRGAQQQSFLVTDEILSMTSLENFCRGWPPPQTAANTSLKHRLIDAVATIARKLHRGGVNHRDFYICHFLLLQDDLPNVTLRLIDLHRAQCRSRTPERWIVKDLGGLYFSAMDLGLSRRDILRFIVRYGRENPALWRAVQRRATRMYRSHFHRKPPAGIGSRI